VSGDEKYFGKFTFSFRKLQIVK